MKCPKCGYLGFERVERCRNCGYDFSPIEAQSASDLSMRPGSQDTPDPLADLALLDAAFQRASLEAEAFPDFQPEGQRIPAAVNAGPTPELPLFGLPISDDVPLITRPSPPRTPLAVRRATPEVPRVRPGARATMFDIASIDAESWTPRATPATPANVRARQRPVEAAPVRDPLTSPAAAVSARVVAAAIDVAVLVAIDVAVVYLTMQICGLALSDIGMIPKTPLLVFLIPQNVSYFVAFTAGGQTLGQMAMGIKVVSNEADLSPGLRQAILRTLVWAILAIPAGLGLLTTLFNTDRRGLHDRFAGTRVVRTIA